MISSQLPRSTEVDVAVELSCDFARLNVIKAGQPTRARPIPVISGDQFAWVEEDIALSLEADGADLQLSDDRCQLTVGWHVVVPAHGEVSVSWRLQMDDIRAVLMPATLPITLWSGPMRPVAPTIGCSLGSRGRSRICGRCGWQLGTRPRTASLRRARRGTSRFSVGTASGQRECCCRLRLNRPGVRSHPCPSPGPTSECPGR